MVGTHALLYEGVEFRDLGLVIVDEQHRFGVEQRDALRAKAEQPPHVLVMTATPIPRTVAMTVYGDLEVSTLQELPPGPVTDRHPRGAGRRNSRRCSSGPGSGYARRWPPATRCTWCAHGSATTSEESEPVSADGRAPTAGGAGRGAAELADGPLAGLRIGVLHGRLPAEDKDAVMRRSPAGELDVLVATTVVEVGVDVPNATMMVILDADRFGVSQLHQLRGRVGRGTAPGLCLLVTDAPADSDARQRLDAVASTLDGFRLAELDLEQRREGDVLGAAQSGRRQHLQLLSLLRDAELISEARAAASRCWPRTLSCAAPGVGRDRGGAGGAGARRVPGQIVSEA